MRICIPTETNNGFDSVVYGHFGSAPCFIIYDTDSKKLELIDNQNTEHAHGQCNPLSAFSQRPIDAMITGGIGYRALEKLNAAGVKAYRIAAESTVKEVIDSFNNGALDEISLDQTCGHGHGCGH